MAAGIGVGIRLRRRHAKTRRTADERLVNLVPEGLRPHEGLVIEARRKQHIGRVVDCAYVALERRPVILAIGRQPLRDFQHRGAGVGFESAGAVRDADQRVRLLRPCRQYAAWTVIFERPTHQMNAVGQQGGSERIALKPFIVGAVEGEMDRPAMVYPALACDAMVGHGVSSLCTICGRGKPALYVVTNLSLRVSRAALKKRPQPWIWRQRS